MSASAAAAAFRKRRLTIAAAALSNIAGALLLFAALPGHAAAAPFVFTVTADSHLDDHTDLGLYRRTLTRAATDKPTFHVDLGDTFMSEKHTNRAAAAQQYLDQRRFFALLGVPVHLVIGNHDGESGRYNDGSTNCLAVWSRAMRTKYFPEPLAPGGRGYYAWETNGALFIVLDPFWYSPRSRRGDDNWFRTLGKQQYDWLKSTLETSHARFKFVFIHHLVGGVDRQGRGGVEVASLYEWGGKNGDGSEGFSARRRGWAMPIHQLLVTHGVTAVFHGHDHLYARQQLDGIVYQECPQPGDPRGTTRSAAEYGYSRGVILASSGYLRISVGASAAKVEYVRLTPGEAESIADSYELKPR